jgi:hypothetical protein
MNRHFIILLLSCLPLFSASIPQNGANKDHKFSVHPAGKPITVDSIPLNARRFYRVDSIRYKKYLQETGRDSVLLIKANSKDWNDFREIRASITQTLKNDSLGNVSSYIDTANDFAELSLLQEEFVPNTARVCLRQLIFTLRQINLLIKKPLTENSDVVLLSAAMKNMDTLLDRYILTFGEPGTVNPQSADLRFNVTDKNGKAVTNAICYLLTPKTCRDIACKTCTVSPDCASDKLRDIIAKNDKAFDCANDVSVPVFFGRYHVFVVSGNKLLSYEMKQVDEHTVRPGSARVIFLSVK